VSKLEVRWLDRRDGDDFVRYQHVKEVVEEESPLAAFKFKTGEIWRIPPGRVIDVTELEEESGEGGE